MTTTLAACVLVPNLLLDLAVQQRGVPSPFAVVDDTALARVRQCCRHAAAAGVTPGMPAFLATQHCPQLTTNLAGSVLDATRDAITTLLGQQGDQLHAVGSTGWCLRVLALGPQYRHAPAVAADLAYAIRAATRLHAVLALAPTTITARIAAQHAADRRHTTPMVILPGDEAAQRALNNIAQCCRKRDVSLRLIGSRMQIDYHPHVILLNTKHACSLAYRDVGCRWHTAQPVQCCRPAVCAQVGTKTRHVRCFPCERGTRCPTALTLVCSRHLCYCIGDATCDT